jgi:hypothetical protein
MRSRIIVGLVALGTVATTVGIALANAAAHVGAMVPFIYNHG